MRYDFCIFDIPAAKMRADKYICETLDICTRNQLQQRLSLLKVNGSAAKPGRKVGKGDRIEIEISDPPKITLTAESIPLSVVFENGDVLVLDKPQGMVVHPGAGNYSGTLANALLYYVDDLDEYNERPGIVHRLDKETSGIIITAKNEKTLSWLSEQFKERAAKKRYLAIVLGGPEKNAGTIDTNIGRSRSDRKKMAVTKTGGKSAVTKYKVLARYGKYTFMVLTPKTGRTHQLRVHMKYLGCPIAGDPVYGDRRDGVKSLMLHAYKLMIRLPDEDVPITFRAPVPDRIKRLLCELADG